MANYQMGPHTFAVPMATFKENRERVADALVEANPGKQFANSIILLQGGSDISLYDTDVDYVFRQVTYSVSGLDSLRKTRHDAAATRFHQTHTNSKMLPNNIDE